MQNYIRDERHLGNSEYDLFIGLDVDKSSIALTVLDGQGMRKSLKMPYDACSLLSFVDGHYANQRMVFAYEAGPTGFGLYDAIIAGGHDCLVVSPGSIPNAPNNRIKTNRLDSVKLANLLSGNQLRGIRIPPEPIRHLRSLVHLRYTYMLDIKAYKCRIKAEMLKEGLEFPQAPKGSGWSNKVIAQLRNLDCPVVVSFKICSMLDHLDHLVGQMKLVETAMKSFINGDSELKWCIECLTSVPGIGWRIACFALSRIGDYRHLNRSNEAGAFFGLVPTEASTGDTIDRGSITRCGDPRLRSMLVQGAWAAIRKDSELKRCFERICSNHPKRTAARVAIVAIARKLAERMHCVLREQRRYEPHRAA
jgi:transposase